MTTRPHLHPFLEPAWCPILKSSVFLHLKVEHFLVGFIKSGFDTMKSFNLVDYQDTYNYYVDHVTPPMLYPGTAPNCLCILVLLDSGSILFISLCVYYQLQDIGTGSKHVCVNHYLEVFCVFQIVVTHNTVNGKPRGYAFIEYEHERDMHCE
jgi:hypothetical protein